MFTLYLLYFQINYLQKLPTSPRSYEKGHCHAVCEDRLLWWGKRICSRKVGCMTGPLERRNFNLNTTTSWSTGFNQKHITLGLYNSGSILLCCFSVNCLWYKTHTEDHWKIYYLLFYFFFWWFPKSNYFSQHFFFISDWNSTETCLQIFEALVHVCWPRGESGYISGNNRFNFV